MKLLAPLLALLLGGWAFDAGAADYFAALDASPLTLWRECAWKVICPSTDYAGRSVGYGARAGLWTAPEGNGPSDTRLGVEIGYARLGSISGTKDYLLNPGCFILCAGATARWKNDASVAYADLLGRIYPFDSPESGAVAAKIGLYGASVTTSGNYGTGGPDYSRKINSAGLMLGAADIYPLSHHLSLTVSADVFFNVKVANPIDPNSTLSEMLLRIAAGVNYDF